MVKRQLENGTTINYMVASRFSSQMATVIGGNSRLATRKDMEHISMLVERDTSGNTCRMTCTGMEYTDGQMEEYIVDK
jgi:hypothetical protein